MIIGILFSFNYLFSSSHTSYYFPLFQQKYKRVSAYALEIFGLNENVSRIGKKKIILSM